MFFKFKLPLSERLRFYYRLKIKDYYDLILAPKMFDSKFSFDEYSRDQVQEMLQMKTQEIILQMTKFEEKFQHDKICIDFVTNVSGTFKVQNNMKEITNFVDFFDSGIFSPEDRAFLDDVKNAEEELELVTLEFGTKLLGSSFEKFSKTKRRRLIGGLKGKHLLRLHDALDAQKNRNFSHFHEMWAENYHIPEFLITRTAECSSPLSNAAIDLEIWKEIHKSLKFSFQQKNTENYLGSVKRSELIARKRFKITKFICITNIILVIWYYRISHCHSL